MAGVNKVIILGRLGRDPELRYLQNGNPVCKLAVATSEKYTKKDTNETVETVEWHRITIWGKLAEIANNGLRKGSQAYFEGKLKTSSYDKDGAKHYATEIICSTLQFVGDKKEGTTSSNKPENSNSGPSKNQKNNSSQEPDFEEPPFENNGGDDDIPF